MEVIKGRMYDYNNGRFLSVDPFIQNPSSTQSMNPYTYIFNNPLSGTDPSGYMSCAETKPGESCNILDIPEEEVESSHITKDGSLVITTKDGNSFKVDSINGKDVSGDFKGLFNLISTLTKGEGISGIKGQRFNKSFISGNDDGTSSLNLFGGGLSINLDGIKDSGLNLFSYFSAPEFDSNAKNSLHISNVCNGRGECFDLSDGFNADDVRVMLGSLPFFAGGRAGATGRGASRGLQKAGGRIISGLPDHLAGTFAGGRFSSRVLKEDLVLFRIGESGKPLGQFFSKDMPISAVQSRIDKAILPAWPGGAKSILDTVFKIKIPAGTTVHTGRVGSQGGHFVGGTQQIVVEKPWLLKGVEVLSETSL